MWQMHTHIDSLYTVWFRMAAREMEYSKITAKLQTVKPQLSVNCMMTMTLMIVWWCMRLDWTWWCWCCVRVPRLSTWPRRRWNRSPGGSTPSTWCGSSDTKSRRPSTTSLNRWRSAYLSMSCVDLCVLMLLGNVKIDNNYDSSNNSSSYNEKSTRRDSNTERWL